jgi:hypothetical protein
MYRLALVGYPARNPTWHCVPATRYGRRFSNVMSGSRAGCQMTIFDFEYETGITIRTERTHAQTVAAFRSEHVVLPASNYREVVAPCQFSFVRLSDAI